MLKIYACISPNKAEFAPLLYAGHIEEGLASAHKYGYDGVELNILAAAAKKDFGARGFYGVTSNWNAREVLDDYLLSATARGDV